MQFIANGPDIPDTLLQAHEEIVKYLLKKGAKVNLRESKFNSTALTHAKTKKINELLKAAGAKE